MDILFSVKPCVHTLLKMFLILKYNNEILLAKFNVKLDTVKVLPSNFSEFAIRVLWIFYKAALLAICKITIHHVSWNYITFW